MAWENARWGYLRIKGELLKLGITVSATTIANVLRRGGLGPAPRRIGPTWGQSLRAQAFAILATGVPNSGPERDRQEQTGTLLAQGGVGRPTLEEECCPNEATAAAPIRDPERVWEPARGLRPDRPSRMQILPLSPLSGGNPRDGPATTRFRRAGRYRRIRWVAPTHRACIGGGGILPGLRAHRQRSAAEDRCFSVIANSGGAGRSSSCTQQVEGSDARGRPEGGSRRPSPRRRGREPPPPCYWRISTRFRTLPQPPRASGGTSAAQTGTSPNGVGPTYV